MCSVYFSVYIIKFKTVMHFPKIITTTLLTSQLTQTSETSVSSLKSTFAPFVSIKIERSSPYLDGSLIVDQQRQRDQLTIISYLANSCSLHLLNINEKLQQNKRQIQYIYKEVSSISNELSIKQEEENRRKSSESTAENHEFLFNKSTFKSENPILNHIFGPKVYRYRLELIDKLPQLLYKQKNFDLRVMLVNTDNQKVMNSSIIHLCFSVCDSNGDWVTKNKNGEDLIKGQTQVELYHGQANFQKMYSRQVTKKYPGSRLNFIIYPKPSLLRYSQSLQMRVRQEDIEPLILRNVRIMSKKI